MENKKKSKTDLNTLKNFKQSTIAGALIGFGVIINLLTNPPALGAALFSFGLLAIIQLQIPLYTGRIGFIINSERQPYWLYLLGNVLGIMLAVSMYALTNPNFEPLFMRFPYSYCGKMQSSYYYGRSNYDIHINR